jgi:hypothetical protein
MNMDECMNLDACMKLVARINLNAWGELWRV